MTSVIHSVLTFGAGIVAYGLGCSLVAYGRELRRGHRDTESGWCE